MELSSANSFTHSWGSIGVVQNPDDTYTVVTGKKNIKTGIYCRLKREYNTKTSNKIGG